MDRLNVSAMLLPLLAVVTIVGYAGGLGIIFILLNETPAHEWAVIALGTTLVVGVPIAAALGQRLVEKQ